MNLTDCIDALCILAISVSLFFAVEDYAERQANMFSSSGIALVAGSTEK